MHIATVGALAYGPRAEATTGRLAVSAPVAPFAVQRLASLPSQPWLAGHRGVDLDAAAGEPVTAPATGVITYVGFVVDRPVVSIRHDQGLVSSFEPVDSTAAVGDVVMRGDVIGTVADAPRHCVRRQCVHWGLRLDGTYVDPLDYLEGFGPIRLLPPVDQGSGD
jgi:murein DD-endopeptidase MepM/ murein hydrolase activator NlpD